MLTEEQLAALPLPLQKQFQQLETDIIKRMCRRVKEIGELSASDIMRLNNLTDIGYDLQEIRLDMMKTLYLSDEIVFDVLSAQAEAEYDGYKEIYKVTNTPWVPFAKNERMQQLLTGIAQTVSANIASKMGLSESITGTTGFKLPDGTWSPTAKYYQEVVDYAALQVRTGQADFYGAMRKSIRSMADSGLCEADKVGIRRVFYNNESKQPYARRLDSSVRNALSGGLQRLSHEQATINGEQFGADGMEISYHSNPRPSHVSFAGKQYNMADYERICLPLLDDYNCYHRAFPIMLGISVPAYSDAELAELNTKDAELHEWRGKQYTGYELTQIQRQYETEIRKQKDRAVAAAAAGDKDGETLAKAKASAINAEYAKFSRSVGLSTKPERTAVSGYTRGTTHPDILIGRSLGANAKNYDIADPDGNILHLTEGTRISNINIIAGAGRDRQIDIVDVLVAKFGGDRDKWQKAKGFGYIDNDGESYKAELHWHQEPSVGIVDMKIKIQQGGNWYIDED